MNALVEEAARHWHFVSPLLTRPATEADYDRLTVLLDDVLSMIADDPEHELAGLASAMGDLLASYDEEHRPMPPVAGVDALRYLMEEHGITPDGLPEIGSAAAVSDVLDGAASIDARQARGLGNRFALAADVFLVP
ncbi:helix-turn-helix domain-containing protein [Lichenibacterium dinghuense]|uniref:helix-turn-helix domain-containing protein n=1 Tax=Lichenibacterium dinghuense TaxID=2895977 RepID=UPI001F2844C3|nr:transcriptional regulator [Lichenibacterium sp. 6Y81]